MFERIGVEKVKASSGYRAAVKVSPTALRAALGEQGEADGCKTTGEYWFQDAAGGVFSLYDYKQTSAYAGGNPTPEEFWSGNEPVDIHVGASHGADVGAFLEWLKKQVPGLEVADRVGG